MLRLHNAGGLLASQLFAAAVNVVSGPAKRIAQPIGKTFGQANDPAGARDENKGRTGLRLRIIVYTNHLDSAFLGIESQR